MARVGGTATFAAARRTRRAPDARAQLPLLVLLAVTVAAVAVSRAVRADGVAATVVDDVALALVATSALGLLGAPAAVRRSRLRRSGIKGVDVMTGEEFEAHLALVLAGLGDEVHHTGRRGDFGADLVIERGGARTVVQAKRYDGAVGIEAVQQVIGARSYYDATAALVVTNSVLTPAALALAAADDVVVVEREDLVSLLAAGAIADGGRPRWGHVRQLADGAGLVLYASVGVVRLSWWVVRSALRLFTRRGGSRSSARRS